MAADDAPTPVQRGVMTAWTLLFDDITRTVELQNLQSAHVDLWLTMSIILSLCEEHPTTMRRVYHVMKAANFPLWDREDTGKSAILDFEDALGMGDGPAAV